MKIYDIPGFPNPLRIRVVLAEKQLASQVEFVKVDLPAVGHKQAAFVKIDPTGTVPVLKLDDGIHVAECTAITEYLDMSAAELEAHELPQRFLKKPFEPSSLPATLAALRVMAPTRLAKFRDCSHELQALTLFARLPPDRGLHGRAGSRLRRALQIVCRQRRVLVDHKGSEIDQRLIRQTFEGFLSTLAALAAFQHTSLEWESEVAGARQHPSLPLPKQSGPGC